MYVRMNVLLITLATLSTVPIGVQAQLGSRPAEEWALVLESGRRMTSLEIDNVVAELNLQPGQIVADIGAGTGIFTVPLAQAVLPGGVAYGVEVDQGFLPMIVEKARQEGLSNVLPVLGEFQDPKLPRSDVDVAFIHDVLHHVEARQEYLLALAGYLAPEARVVIVDYHGDHPASPHQGEPEMLISLEEVNDWMAAAGFRVERKIDLFEEKFFVIYRRGS